MQHNSLHQCSLQLTFALAFSGRYLKSAGRSLPRSAMSCLSLGTFWDETSRLAGASCEVAPLIPSLLASKTSPAQPYGCLPLRLSPAQVDALPVRWCIVLFRHEFAQLDAKSCACSAVPSKPGRDFTALSAARCHSGAQRKAETVILAYGCIWHTHDLAASMT